MEVHLVSLLLSLEVLEGSEGTKESKKNRSFLSSEIINKAIYFIISENYQLATIAYGFYLLSTLCSSLTLPTF